MEEVREKLGLYLGACVHIFTQYNGGGLVLSGRIAIIGGNTGITGPGIRGGHPETVDEQIAGLFKYTARNGVEVTETVPN